MAWNKTPLETEEEKISRINSAGIINITTENLWRDCYSSMAKGDLVTWNRKLDALWLILGGDTTDKLIDDEFNKIDLQLHTTGSLKYKKTGFQTPTDYESGIKAVQYLILRKKSLFLRRLQNKQGKGTAYDTGDDYDIE
jgi:hypothetical protein